MNELDSSGWTALSSSAFYGSTECLQKLLSAGADVNFSYREGRTALLESVWISNNQWDQYYEKEQPVEFQQNYKQEECLEILITAGANVNSQTDSGVSALMKAAANGYNDCVNLLLKAGADVNATCKEGYTSLMYSAMFGNEVCLNDLLAAGANVNTKEMLGSTALIIASTYGHDKCVKSLVEKGADVNVKDNEEFTALIRAACISNFKCIEHLLNVGANVNGTTAENITALMAVCGIHSEYFCTKLIKCTGNTYLSEHYSALKSTETLINAGADVNIKDYAGITPLIKAIWRHHKECVPILLAAGADVNATDPEGSSALILAIRTGKDETFDQLLKAGADVNIVNNTGDTALLAATVKGNVRAAKRLLKANCRINIAARVTNMSLMRRLYSVKEEHVYLAKLLFAAGEMSILTNMMTQHRSSDGSIVSIARYVRQYMGRKLQLDHITRETIRLQLLESNPQQNLFSRISHLGLPEPLKRYLLHDQSLDDDDNQCDDTKSNDGNDNDDDYDDWYDEDDGWTSLDHCLMKELEPHKPHNMPFAKIKDILLYY